MSSDMRLDHTYENEHQYWSYDTCIILRGFSIVLPFYSGYKAVPYLVVPRVNRALLMKYHYVIACDMPTWASLKSTFAQPKVPHACVRLINAGT